MRLCLYVGILYFELITVLSLHFQVCLDFSSPDCARQFLKTFNKDLTKMRQQEALLFWNFKTNARKENQEKMGSFSSKSILWLEKKREISEKFQVNGLTAKERRQFKLLSYSLSSTNQTVVKEIVRLVLRMDKVYSSARVCLNNGQCLEEGESGIVNFFKTTRDPLLLEEAWRKWRDVTGRRYKTDWIRALELRNSVAKERNLHDVGEAERRFDFETQHLGTIVTKLFDEIRPLYLHLHGYVRHKLREIYPNTVQTFGPLPAHLLGDPWGQNWLKLFPFIKPFSKKKSYAITKTMKEDGWTIERMVRTADNLFHSLGFEKMTPKFWKHSIFVKPFNRVFDCHASASNFFTGDDFRIKMCAEIDEDSLITIHHEMGHIVYFMSYKLQPPLFQEGANSAFHEAVGDSVALSVKTPAYMKKLGLIKAAIVPEESEETNINNLMQAALYRVAILPFAFVVDSWRWGAYNGSITPEEYNTVWWRLRHRYQGLTPPVQRSSRDFDPGAKHHIVNDIPYIRYFLSFIIQFEFYEAMCRKSGYPDTSPLHLCDFSGSQAAGKLLRNVLEMGRSELWPNVMQKITGQRHIRADAFLNYFKPLFTWLKEYNCKHDIPVGWDGKDEKTC